MKLKEHRKDKKPKHCRNKERETRGNKSGRRTEQKKRGNKDDIMITYVGDEQMAGQTEEEVRKITGEAEGRKKDGRRNIESD